ncbi:MAG: hypothetical protein GX306_00090 [Clostridiales bacterium]|jgi:transposase|nr:hypothetical protein [Clostridiales bacterium]HOK75677.1 hypothetical protein [Bacteroidales bacterium]
MKSVDKKRKIPFLEYIDDHITENNQARIVDVFAASLDSEALGFKKDEDIHPDRPAYNPAGMLKLLMYGCMICNSLLLQVLSRRRFVGNRLHRHRYVLDAE